MRAEKSAKVKSEQNKQPCRVAAAILIAITPSEPLQSRSGNTHTNMYAEFRMMQEMEKQQAQGAAHFGRWLRMFFKFFGTIK
jgi:hypothetical protein